MQTKESSGAHNAELTIKYRSVADLAEYEGNSRSHSDDQIAQVAASIQEYGFTNPLLIDADGILIAGHGRLMAAKSIGLEQVPCIELGHLTDDQRRAYVIADNKLAELSEWDEDALKAELDALVSTEFDILSLGFNTKELEKVLSTGLDANNDSGQEEALSEEVPEQYMVLVDLGSEVGQVQLLNKLLEEGYSCKALTS